MRGLMNRFSDEEFARIVKESFSYAECLKNLGYIARSGPAHGQLKEKIDRLNIDVSHFRAPAPIERTRENVFIENSTCDQATLRRWYRKENVPYQCSICGQEPFWNGKEMIMILDHINGKNHDDRLENLRWVCPNCNSQLPTNGSKNKEKVVKDKSQYQCPICGKPVSEEGRHCRQCIGEHNRKAERPPVLEFAKMVKEVGFKAIGKKYGISGRSVQKWCEEYYHIPHKRAELIAWYDERAEISDSSTIDTHITIPGMARPVKQIDPKTGEVINVFPSQNAAYAALGVKQGGSIGQVCRGVRKTAFGYIWEYA